MKKYIYSAIIILMLMSISISTYSKPWYIGFRLGFRADWAITFGECVSGNGVCLSIGSKSNSDNAELGYDEAINNIFYLKVVRSSDLGRYFSNGKLEIEKDSPIDPSLIAKFRNFKNPNKQLVIIKKGTYPVKTEGEYYIVALNYYLQ